MAKTNLTTTIDYDLKKKLEELLPALSFADVVDFGVRFKLAEIGEEDYPTNKLINNISRLQTQLMEQQEQINALEESKQDDSPRDN